jgi:hypothetical protein
MRFVFVSPAFEPISCALLAHALEHVAVRLCNHPSARGRSVVYSTQLWLRRHSDALLDTLIPEETTEPLLDLSNHVIHTELMRLGIAAALLLLIVRLLLGIFSPMLVGRGANATTTTTTATKDTESSAV